MVIETKAPASVICLYHLETDVNDVKLLMLNWCSMPSQAGCQDVTPGRQLKQQTSLPVKRLLKAQILDTINNAILQSDLRNKTTQNLLIIYYGQIKEY